MAEIDDYLFGTADVRELFHPAGRFNPSPPPSKLRCSILADWLVKNYAWFSDTSWWPDSEDFEPAKGKMAARVALKRIVQTLFEDPYEQPSIAPHMNEVREDAERLQNMIEMQALPDEELAQRFYELKGKYLDTAISLLCNCETGAVPLDNKTQMEKHWEATEPIWADVEGMIPGFKPSISPKIAGVERMPIIEIEKPGSEEG